MSDAINPDHYKQGSIQCIDAMQQVLSPEEFQGYLKGNVFKYIWREKHKNGIEDLRKAKWYLDRLIEHCDIRESLPDISNGLVKAWTCENGNAKQVYPEPKWNPQIGDWVRIKKPADTQSSACIWVGSMNNYDGQVIHVQEIEEGAVVHEDYGFLFSWLEPTEPPKEQPQLPDGYRWLEAGEVIRKGDAYWHGGKWWDYDNSIGEKVRDTVWSSIRRNRFEVGEKVVRVFNGVVYKVIRILSMCYQLESEFCPEVILYGKDLAPYIEEKT